MRHTRRGFPAMAAPSFLAVAALGALPNLPAPTHARHATAIGIVSLYMTTEQAYDAYGNDSPAPPRVTAFPQGVYNVGVFFDYQGMRAHKTTYRVAIFQHGTEVRHGAVQTFGDTSGSGVLRIPADELQALGVYKATLYVGNAATLTTTFSVIRTPTINASAMITAHNWSHFHPHDPDDGPAAVYCYPAGVSRVFAAYDFSGMAKTDRYYVAVYNATGQQVHRSLDYGAVYDAVSQERHRNQERAAAGYAPDARIAIRLPADAGHYPKGKYRTDLYVNGATVDSLTWSIPC